MDFREQEERHWRLTFSGWDERLCRGTQKSGTPLSRFFSNIAAAGSLVGAPNRPHDARLATTPVPDVTVSLSPPSSPLLLFYPRQPRSAHETADLSKRSDHSSPRARGSRIYRARRRSRITPLSYADLVRARARAHTFRRYCNSRSPIVSIHGRLSRRRQ